MARRESSPKFTGQVTVLHHSVYQRFGRFAPSEAWAPPVNVYQRPGRLEICVDLAGIQREQIDVRVERGRLLVQGVRPAPEPRDGPDEPMRILDMEIDYGPFRREIPLPENVRLDQVESRYDCGLLWISLPLTDRPPAP